MRKVDVVDEFYLLFLRVRENLMLEQNLIGITKYNERVRFCNLFLIQLFIVWFLQEKGGLNKDRKFLINQFLNYKKMGFESYFAFLKYLFGILMSDSSNGFYYEDEKIGKIIILGSVPFFRLNYDNIEIDDRVFFEKEQTELLRNNESKKFDKVSILNLFESQDLWNTGIEGFVLGAIYEKLMTIDERKKTGSYYTPKNVTKFISQNSIESFLLEKINRNRKSSNLAEISTLSDIYENENSDLLIELLDILSSVKILDPAVGAAHFLECAVDMLSNIYEKVWIKVKKLGIQDKINTIYKRSNVFSIDLKERSLFQMYIRIYIVFPYNIYGIDINSEAIAVAKLRLLLSVIRFFDANNSNHFTVKFSNIRFNLKIGDSLIGLAGIPRSYDIKSSLLRYIEPKHSKKKTEIAKECLNKDKKFESYVISTSEKLGIKDIISEISEVKSIFGKDIIDWNDFKEILKLKVDLINVLRNSFNSEQFNLIESFVGRFDELFRSVADEKFLEMNGEIKKRRFQKIDKRFHWVFEFPEVFIGREGFDIIIGNPPYVNLINEQETRKFLEKQFDEVYSGKADLWFYFVVRSIKLLSLNGVLSFIVSRYFLNAPEAAKLRRFLKDNTTIRSVWDFRDYTVFKGISIQTLIFDLVKNSEHKNNLISYYFNFRDDELLEFNEKIIVKQSDIQDEWSFELLDINDDTYRSIIKKVKTKLDNQLQNVAIISKGIVTGNDKLFVIPVELSKKYNMEKQFLRYHLKGNAIKPYQIIGSNRMVIIESTRNNFHKVRQANNIMIMIFKSDLSGISSNTFK